MSRHIFTMSSRHVLTVYRVSVSLYSMLFCHIHVSLVLSFSMVQPLINWRDDNRWHSLTTVHLISTNGGKGIICWHVRYSTCQVIILLALDLLLAKMIQPVSEHASHGSRSKNALASLLSPVIQESDDGSDKRLQSTSHFVWTEWSLSRGLFLADWQFAMTLDDEIWHFEFPIE